ncbi:MAG: hypothetical protein U0736_14760 [Gemmataceae bacterium]
MQWWAFGKAAGQRRLRQRARTDRDGLDRCLLEIANLANEARQVRVTLAPLGGGDPLRRSVLDLGPDETGRLILQFPDGTRRSRARIDGGALPLDGRVVLLPAPARAVRAWTCARRRPAAAADRPGRPRGAAGAAHQRRP